MGKETPQNSGKPETPSSTLTPSQKQLLEAVKATLGLVGLSYDANRPVIANRANTNGNNPAEATPNPEENK